MRTLLKLISIFFIIVNISSDTHAVGFAERDDALNGRPVILDDMGKILPWNSSVPAESYAEIIDLTVEFMCNDVLTEHGHPMYYCRPAYSRTPPHTGRNWYSNPADVLSGMIHSYVEDYYAFTGNDTLKNDAIDFADYMIQEGSTPVDQGWAWHGCPYSQDEGGVLPPRGSDVGGSIMPHLVGKLGKYYVWLYKATDDSKYLTAALHCADSLAANQRTGTQTQSPWPFRVMPDTNDVYNECEYTADVIDPIALFDELIALGETGGGSYSTARNAAWTWLFSSNGPMVTGNWSNYFEDMPFSSDNFCQINIGETARYLLEHPELDPNWESHVADLISEMESVFGTEQYGAITMNEQLWYYHPMISHTARYASICARYYEMTGDASYKEKAFRAFNWSTYGSTAEIDRVFTEIMDAPHGWFTDCHADFVQHFISGMASVPEWAPYYKNSILRTSSVIKSVHYSPTRLDYSVFDPAAQEVIRCTTKPDSVEAGGIPLPERSDLDQEGWTWTPLMLGGVCRIRHDISGDISLHWNALPSLSGFGISIILLLFSLFLIIKRS